MVVIKAKTIKSNLNRVVNQIYKLLPMFEEDMDWQKPVDTLVIEVLGMSSLLNHQTTLFSLACKLKGLQEYDDDIPFQLFRRTVFECCGLAGQVRDNVNEDFICET